MRYLLAGVMCLCLTGCTMRPFGFAPWLIVMPGAHVELNVINKQYNGPDIEQPQLAPEGPKEEAPNLDDEFPPDVEVVPEGEKRFDPNAKEWVPL